jgi:hypothetical protein
LQYVNVGNCTTTGVGRNLLHLQAGIFCPPNQAKYPLK